MSKFLVQTRLNFSFSAENEAIVNRRADACFEKLAKYEAIHALVKLSGSNIKGILAGSPKQLSESEVYEKQLNDHARVTTNNNGKKHFSLNSKYLASFSPFYYQNLNENSEALKNFEEFYKSEYKKMK